MQQVRLGFAEVDLEDQRRILKVLDSKRFSPDYYCSLFEKFAAGVVGSQHAVFVNSGTDALRLSLLAVKEKYGWPDDVSVAVPSITFVATVNVVLQAGLKPFFVDVDMKDFNMNPDNLEWRLSTAPRHNVKAIMPVHMFGKSCDMARIKKIAKKHDLKIIEDSCESIGPKIQGDALCFSTYQAHIIATGIGGIAATNDDQLNELIRSLANHGRDPAYLPGFRTPPLSKELLRKRFRFERIGYSCRPSEFQAALGIGQIERLARNLDWRVHVAARLNSIFSEYDDFILPTVKDHSFMMYPVAIKEWSAVDRDDLCLKLEENGIETRPLMPITSQPCYQGIVREEDFPVAKWLNQKGFYIPCHPGVTENHVEFIAFVLSEFMISRKKAVLTKT